MSILRRLKTDGTFDQTRPLDYLSGFTYGYSYDLKSATDRWPLPVLFALASLLLGPTLASSVVQAALSYNTFVVSKPEVSKERSLVFMAGQPLGMYGSWPLFTLSHHFVVWLAAERAYPGHQEPFQSYAVLGDDVVITDPKVAVHYRSLLDQLGVTISYPVSDRGCLEFAKRFRVRGGVRIYHLTLFVWPGWRIHPLDLLLSTPRILVGDSPPLRGSGVRAIG